MEPNVARRVWNVLEPIHAVIYFAPEARNAFTALGLKGFWMGYFASRAAPLGPVGPEIVTATFYGFAPRMVAKALPDAWHYAAPADVLTARYEAADPALGRLLGAVDVSELAELATAAAKAARLEGRALFAAHAALPWPSSPRLALWHAATLLREHRGDGHVAALMSAGVDGCEAHQLAVAAGAATREALQPNRGWTDGEWAAAAANVEGREAELRTQVEATTDELALQPLEDLGDAPVSRLIELATPLARTIVEQGGLPVPNPIGVGSP